jgi:PTH2 family peptidyl-tRNA hydrolase
MKQAIVVRMDLGMSPGKMAAQAAHAAMSSTKASKTLFERWKKEGQKKVVLKAQDLEHMKTISERAKKNGVKYAFVKDAGMTELKPGTITCLSIGPDKDNKIDKVVGDLSLL